MTHIIHDLGVARQIGSYSDAIEARPNQRWLLTSGTPGLSTTGDLPKDVSSQAERAWEHVVRMLERAGITVTEIVKVTQYLTRAEDIPAYGKVRRRFLGDVRPHRCSWSFSSSCAPSSWSRSKSSPPRRRQA